MTRIINDISDIPVNSKGYIEIVTRLKNGTIKAIGKYVIQESPKDAKNVLEKMNVLINNNNKIFSKATKTINSVKNLQLLSFGLQGVDLCATAIGFAIVCSKLDDVNSKMDDIIDYMKDKTDIEVNYHMSRIVEEYENMLDIYDRDELPDEEDLRRLVVAEYNFIKNLLLYMNRNMSNDKISILFGIKTLSNMLAVTLCKYDEVYFFKHKEKKKSNFHNNHDKWLSVFDELSGSQNKKLLNDFLYLDCGYDQFQTDIVIKAWIDDFKNAKQAVEDRDFLIVSNEEREKYQQLIKDINIQAYNELQENIDDAVVCELVKNSAINLGIIGN